MDCINGPETYLVLAKVCRGWSVIDAVDKLQGGRAATNHRKGGRISRYYPPSRVCAQEMARQVSARERGSTIDKGGGEITELSWLLFGGVVGTESLAIAGSTWCIFFPPGFMHSSTVLKHIKSWIALLGKFVNTGVANMNSSRFSHSYHFSIAGIIKLSNLESVIDSLNIPSAIGLSLSSILLAALVFISVYALILLYVRVGSSRRTPSVPCKEYASRRGVGQKGEIAITVPAPIGSTQETELRVSKETNFPKDWWTSERLFQAEKRAIFSKVTNPDQRHISAPQSNPIRSRGSMQHTTLDSRSQATIFPSS